MRDNRLTDLKDKTVDEAFWSAFPREHGMHVATISFRFTDGTLAIVSATTDKGLICNVSDQDGIDLDWDAVLDREFL